MGEVGNGKHEFPRRRLLFLKMNVELLDPLGDQPHPLDFIGTVLPLPLQLRDLFRNRIPLAAEIFHLHQQLPTCRVNAQKSVPVYGGTPQCQPLPDLIQVFTNVFKIKHIPQSAVE